MSEDISIGNRIARSKGDRSQVQFAKDLGVSQSLLSEWLSEVSLPSAPGYVKLAMQAAKSDASEALFFWSQAGLDPEAVVAAANEALKRGGVKMDEILATAEAKLNERMGDQKQREDEGKDFIVPPYGDTLAVPFEVSVAASLVSSRASTYYITAQPSSVFTGVGHGLAPGDIIVFDASESSIGEEVLAKLSDGLFIGRIGIVEENLRRYTVLGPADEPPNNWALHIHPPKRLRVIGRSSANAHLPPRDLREPESCEILGRVIARFSTGSHDYWKRSARR